MRWSRAYIPTLRETPADAEVVSHQLMLRAGMIRRLASGIYSYLPLGWKVIRRVEQIIREELNAAGAQEVNLPVVQPKEIWEESARWALYGKEMGRLTDRHGNEFCLQPTSEEAITDLLRRDLKSYRQLPVNLYQIQTKFRDEIRPRFGIMRGREFIMKDAYSFDLTEEGARASYQSMREAYRNIFTRTGLEFRAVEADTGAIGGNDSEEFVVLADSGEDEVVSCSKCDYAANQEKARSAMGSLASLEMTRAPSDTVTPSATFSTVTPSASEGPLPESFPTPGLKSIEDLAQSLSVPTSSLMKTIVLMADGGVMVLVLLRGDHELNMVKLGSVLLREKKLSGVRLARDDEMQQWGLPKGSLGPFEFPHKFVLIVDDAISVEAPYITGANREGYHYKNVVISRDSKSKAFVACIRNISEGDSCPLCSAPLRVQRGIEVGHVFYLGRKYSKAMKLTVTGEDGKEQLVEMGCYGIGVGRTVAACIEQNHDEHGIVWPVGLAPFMVGISSLDEGEAQELAEALYREFVQAGVDVLWDDRALSPGVKLKDMDLIGVPYQIVIGSRSLKSGEVEWKQRKGSRKEMISKASIHAHAMNFVRDSEGLGKC